MAASVVLLSVLCVMEQMIVHSLTQMALEQTAGILEDIRAGDISSAKEKAHALDETWDKKAVQLEILIDHSTADDVRYALSRLIAALEGGDRAAALIYAGELEGSIEHVYERQALSVENIL